MIQIKRSKQVVDMFVVYKNGYVHSSGYFSTRFGAMVWVVYHWWNGVVYLVKGM